jgi:hypothetical protein
MRWILIALSMAGIAPQIQPAPSHATSREYNVALGVGCEHCHVEERWTNDSKQAFRTARNMARMVADLNAGLLKDVDGIGCWTCHAGGTRPSRFPGTSLDSELARWPNELSTAPESQKLTMTVYSVSLGVGCQHCHSTDWKALDKPPIKLVATMSAMFTEFPKYMPATARTQCWMCHKGRARPERRPPPAVDR